MPIKEEVVDVVSDGDVVFVGTREIKSKKISVRIRVSSSIVSHASPVLRAMLAPEFKEGSTLAATGFVEIPLPDDQPDSLVILFDALHLRNQYLPRRLNYNSLQALSDVADKYDCCLAIGPVVHLWISGLLASSGGGDTIRLFEASYRFGQPQLFEDIGRRLLLECVRTMERSGGDLAHVFNALEARKQAAIVALCGLVETIARYGSAQLVCPSACDASVRIATQFSQLVRDPSMLPSANCSLAGSYRKWRDQMFHSLLRQEETACQHPNCVVDHIKYVRDRILRKIKDDIDDEERRLPRLCFSCVRTGEGMFQTFHCQGNHDIRAFGV